MDQRRLAQQRLELGADLVPRGAGGTRHLGFDRAPASRRKVRAKATTQVDGLADVERLAAGILEHVHARRRRRVGADPLSGATPDLASILEHQRLRDEPARELGRRAADAEHLGGEPLMVGRVAHLGEPGEQAVTKHTAGRSAEAFALTV